MQWKWFLLRNLSRNSTDLHAVEGNIDILTHRTLGRCEIFVVINGRHVRKKTGIKRTFEDWSVGYRKG